MINVPSEFMLNINTVYPYGNLIIFEDWLSKQDMPNTEREYLPIQWTSYFVNNQYGNDKEALKKLQLYIDTLPKDKKYWTCVQYDDGILVDVSGIDLLQFSMSKNVGIRIPLLSMPHEFKQSKGKDILVSFVGSHTHPIREHIFLISDEEYYISKQPHSENEFCDIVSRSVFGLCPRGYGLSSFRIGECLQYGTIPVYISDEFIIPFDIDFNKFGLIIEEKDSHKIEKVLGSIPLMSIIEKQNNIKDIYEKYYTYDGAFKEIKKYLES
jgi:hypothetical protein